MPGGRARGGPGAAKTRSGMLWLLGMAVAVTALAVSLRSAGNGLGVDAQARAWDGLAEELKRPSTQQEQQEQQEQEQEQQRDDPVACDPASFPVSSLHNDNSSLLLLIDAAKVGPRVSLISKRVYAARGRPGHSINLLLRIEFNRPPPASCSHLVRVSLFNARTGVVVPDVEHRYFNFSVDSSFVVSATAHVGCAGQRTAQLISFVNIRYLDHNRSIVSNHVASCPCWPPQELVPLTWGEWSCNKNFYRDSGAYNLLRLEINVPACEVQLSVLPLCASSADLGRGMWLTKSERLDLVDENIGALSSILGSYTLPWRALLDDVEWVPHGCRILEFVQSKQMLPLLANRTVLFTGDSTMVEFAMLVVELFRPLGFQTKFNSAAFTAELKGHRKLRLFDSEDRFEDGVRIGMLWNAGPNAYHGGSHMGVQDALGSSKWKARFRNFTAASSTTTLRRSSLVVFNTGLHELLMRRFNFRDYERDVRAALSFFKKEGVSVVMLSTSPPLRRHTCSVHRRGGLVEVEQLNAIAAQVARSMDVAFIDTTALRLGSPTEGDGHHCCENYFAEPPWFGKRKFGASCTWRARLLLHWLASVEK